VLLLIFRSLPQLNRPYEQRMRRDVLIFFPTSQKPGSGQRENNHTAKEARIGASRGFWTPGRSVAYRSQRKWNEVAQWALQTFPDRISGIFGISDELWIVLVSFCSPTMAPAST